MTAWAAEPSVRLGPTHRPGLEVVVAARPAEPAPGPIVVEVQVRGGRPPFCLALYVDGVPVGLGSGEDVEYDEGAGWLRSTLHGLRPGSEPRALTARAVDACGRWGSASAVLAGGAVGIR